MSDSDIPLPLISVGLRSTADELKSVWTAVPLWGGKFLLPRIASNCKNVPVFYEDGSVGIEPTSLDPGLAAIASEFVFSAMKEQHEQKEKTGGLKILAGLALYGQLIKATKAILLKNYDLPEDQVLKLLSWNTEEFRQMFQIIFIHCRES